MHGNMTPLKGKSQIRNGIYLLDYIFKLFNKLSELKNNLKGLRKNRGKSEKHIKEIEAYDKDKQKRYSFELQAGQTNIQAMNIREEKLVNKIKTL